MYTVREEWEDALVCSYGCRHCSQTVPTQAPLLMRPATECDAVFSKAQADLKESYC